MSTEGRHSHPAHHSRIGDLGHISPGIASNVVFAIVGIGAGLALGIAEAYGAKVAVAVSVVALIGVLVVRRPVNLAVLALVGVYFVQRVGGSSLAAGSSGGVSYSDALLAAASFMAIPAVIGSGELRRLQIVMLGVGGYLICLLPTIFLNPSSRADLEWLHRLVLVGGALIVGAWIAREGYARVALRWFTAVTVLLSVLAIENWASHGFHAASPIGLNKNFVGAQFAATIILVVVARHRIGLSRPIWYVAVVLIGAALLASQSRGGELGAAFGLVIAFVLSSQSHSRTRPDCGYSRCRRSGLVRLQQRQE